jgi:hypothetical protein
VFLVVNVHSASTATAHAHLVVTIVVRAHRREGKILLGTRELEGGAFRQVLPAVSILEPLRGTIANASGTREEQDNDQRLPAASNRSK